MKIRNYEIFKIHSDYCRVFSNPKRLMILALLSKREMSVGEIAETIGIPLASVSQHLSALRGKHIVDSRKEGQMVYYRPTDSRLMEACLLIRTVLLDGMKKRGEIALEMDADGVVVDDE